jgi:DNA-binding MarR family transcriptional regulator
MASTKITAAKFVEAPIHMPMKMRHQEQAMRVGLTVLVIIAAAGFVAMAAAAPGVAAFAKLFPARPEWRRRYYLDAALRRLIRRGFVEETRRGRIVGYQLTDRGREYLVRRELQSVELAQPRKWDGKWRLVTFDVPEKRRHLRDHLRAHLTRLGFYPLQQSVWLYPYPCEEVVRLIKVDLELGRKVQCIAFKRFEDREEEKSWRLHFDV